MRNKLMLFVSIALLAILIGCENDETLEVSSTFALPVTFNDGTEGEYLLIGKEGKIGFLVGSGKKGEVVADPFIVNQANKYMWHFWGNPETMRGDFKVVGTDETGKDHPVLISTNEPVWEYSDISISPHNGADSHIPSQMLFPTSGIWKLAVYFNEELFDEIVINVEED